MFKDCSIMVIRADDPTQILRLEIDAETQQEICQTFSIAVERLVKGKNKILVDGNYKPDDDEFLSIENFIIPDEIKEAIRNPIGVTAFKKENGEFPAIKAIFIGKCTKENEAEELQIAFQRFKKEQNISVKGFNIFFNKDTFRRERNFGINISDSIHCYYVRGELQFFSFYIAKQIFDLTQYYRSALDPEVDEFISNKLFYVENIQKIKNMIDDNIRRKIALINDSGIIKQNSAAEIKRLAKSERINISVKNKKIIFPNDKNQLKILLGFLDEGAYKGPFTQNIYIANSKRRINKI